MHKSLFEVKHVIVQGITGSHGAFHTAAMCAAGTSIVAGTSPSKAGQFVNGVPVYKTILDIKKVHPTIDASVVFVPAPFAKVALLEAIAAEIPLIVCITENIPVHDMLVVKKAAAERGVTIIGPNCPGILIPAKLKLGIIPVSMALPGSVAIVSRSGTLTYEVAAGLSAKGIGQAYIIGIGGDRVRGTSFIDCLKLFEEDPAVSSIVLIGEIGGSGEQQAAAFITQHITKPIYAYIAGHSAPLGVQLGHAGAILGSTDETAAAKTRALSQAGAHTSRNIAALIEKVVATYLS